MKTLIISIIYLLCFSLNWVMAQTTVRGIIVDAKTNEAIPLVSLFFIGHSSGTVSDNQGYYNISTKDSSDIIEFVSLGYKKIQKKVIVGKDQEINIKMVPDSKLLNEITVRSAKKRYKNKNNPAVELIEKVIFHKSKNRAEEFDYYDLEKYEKLEFALSNITEEFKNKKSMMKFKFIFNNIDTLKVPGKKILPIYIKETLSHLYYRKKPKATKEYIMANKTINLEGFDNMGISTFFKFLYQDINVYDNNISILTNQFVSPVSNIATVFYRYYIMDTSNIDNVKCVRVLFYPRNTNDFLFHGNLYITLDSSFAIKKATMWLNKNINMNWVNDLKINQTFERKDEGWMLTKDELEMNFGYSSDTSKMGLYGKRTLSNKNIQINIAKADTFYSGLAIVEDKQANRQTEAFWGAFRHETLDDAEAGTYKMMDSIQRIPLFKRTRDLFLLAFTGYKSYGAVEIGPVSTFYSYNPVEGWRIRFGGRTTPVFSKKINFETYIAYGFKDEIPKYYLGTIYSFTPRSIYEFPVKSLKLSYQYETKIPGQELQFIEEDNVLLSIKRGTNDKILYNRNLIVEYLNEFNSHFSYTLGFQLEEQTPGGSLHFNKIGYNEGLHDISHLNTTELYTVLRYAPNEQFYQGKEYRIPLSNKYPVYTLGYNAGIKSVLGGDYSYHRLTATFTKRCFLSFLGYADLNLEAGRIIGKLPFPLLEIHRANQTYSYQYLSYNLMNFLEFVSDKYISLSIDQCFNGFFFNKIPLLKALKLREVISCKLLYGSLDNFADTYKLPIYSNGTPLTYSFDNGPYVEGSVGVVNIFKFFRVDMVHRFTYTDHPNITLNGLRMRFKLDF